MLSSNLATNLSLLHKAGLSAQNQEAWTTFVERYRPLILHWCGRRELSLHNSEDVANEVLLKLTKCLARYDPGKGRFRAWLKTVVKNAIIDWQRHEGKEPAAHGDGFDELMKCLPDPIAMADLFDELGSSIENEFTCETLAIERVRATVEPHRWEAFYRTVVQNEKPTDVALALNRNSNEVYQAKFFVLKRIRAEFDKLRNQKASECPP